LQADLAGLFEVLFGALALLVWVCPVHGASFSDGFESYAQGLLDKNYAGGANAATNGSGNPWWGPHPPNFTVVGAENGVTPHSGAQMARNEIGSLFQVPFFDSDLEYYNLAFRLNAGNLYYGNVVLDWWFYDPCGAGTTDPLDQTNYGDFAGLCNYATGIPGNADYDADLSGNAEAPSNAVQCLMLGAAYVWGAADTTKYQAQVLGAADGLSSAYPTYFDTATPRSVGWHNARIVVGPAAAATDVAAVGFYIDDMINPTLTHDNAGGVGMNCIQLSSLQNYGIEGPVGGYFDDFYFQDGVAAPAIAGGLTNQTVDLGDTVTLAVSGVTGAPAPALYWQKDGEAVTNSSQISGVGTSALTISGVTPANLGAYSVVASNIAGAAVSSAIVGLPAPPTLDSQSPTGGTVLASLGGAITFSVTAHAGQPINYRWNKGGSPLSDGTGIFGSATATLTLSNLAAGNAGSYSCLLSNAEGATDSVPVTLVLPLTPVILSQPAGLVIGAGSNAAFTVAAVGPDLVYLWSKGATPLSGGGRVSGAASASLAIAGVTDSDAGAYSCLITNVNGSTNTAAASLVVVDPPVFTLEPQPASQVTYAGSNLVFQVAAQGTLPLSYQWFLRGVPLVDGPNISGATTPALALTVTSTGDEGLYQCTASNFANVAASAGAAVWVDQTEVMFTDRFETYPACCLSGGPGLSGPRGGGPLDGQGPWRGWNSPNIRVYTAQNGITPHSGLQMIGGPINGAISLGDNDRTYLNLSYRFNSGGLYLGNILLEWYFCDLYPTNYASYSDQISLCNYGSDMPPDQDQGTNKPGNLIQRLAIGGWEGGDLTTYQCAVMTASDGLDGNNGELGGVCKYFNTTAARASGWHHARILVGPADAASGIAKCSFFIDDMLQPVLTHDNAGGIGFNSIDIASDVIYSGGNGQAAAGYFDDLSFRAVNDPFILEQPISQTVQSGGAATLAIAAFGSSFQWQKDGVNLGGATDMQLTINPALSTNAGSYVCVVTGANGSVVSSPAATLTVSSPGPAFIKATLVGRHGVVITWTGSYVLQSALKAGGPYQDVSGATSPYTNSLPLTSARFFRLRSSAVSPGPTLTAARAGRNAVVITWTGSYVLQSAPKAGGPYQDVTGAASPYTNSLPLEPAQFFRLRN
jgi:hypothetical protein